MKQFIILLFSVCVISAQAQVTFSEHIAPIIYKHCTSCHRPGEIGPFPLTNYLEVAANANTIKDVTSIRYMPPWKAKQDYGHFIGENILSDEQIQMIADWVEQDVPRGDASLEPHLPVYPGGSQIGVPDLVLSFDRAYSHIGNNKDEYRYFVIPTGLTEDKDLIALEVRPGNKQIVHHTLIWEDTTGTARMLDEQTPEYGYEGGAGDDFEFQNQLPGYVPGMHPIVMSHGIAQKLHAGSDLKLQMHYAPSPVTEKDSTTINLFFSRTPAQRYLLSHIMLPVPATVNDLFIIPANQKKEFHGKLTVPYKVSLYSITPHMHMLGTFWKVYAVPPVGDTIPLINIEAWDFNWQNTYQFKKLVVLPAGTVIHAIAGYDNTSANPSNPFNPPRFVTWGENTSDEMYYLPISYLLYQPGDENIEFEDHTVSIGDVPLHNAGDKLYPVSPNPSAGGMIKIGYTLKSAGKVNISLLDQAGREIRSVQNSKYHLPGFHTIDVHPGVLEAGIYLIVMEKDGNWYSEKLVITE